MREKLVPKIIQFLAASRPIESGRIELFPYAEAFAYLIKLELISSSGLEERKKKSISIQ